MSSPRSVIIARGCLAALALVLTTAALAAEPDTTPDEVKAGAAHAIPEPERQRTAPELRDAIESVQRDLEELLIRIGDREPTAEQRQKLQSLLAQVRQFRAELQTVEQKQARKADADDRSFKARWMRLRKASEDFTNYDLKNGMFRIRVGIKLQLDATFVGESDGLAARIGPIDNSGRARRGRVYAAGRLLRRFDFKFDWDFAVDSGLKDVYLEGAKWTRYFKWRIGQFREPFSLGRQTGSNYFGFMEWALPVQSLAPGRSLGLMFRHNEAKNRLFWAFAATTLGGDEDSSRNESNLTFTGRVTGLPQYRDDGKRLVHLGTSFSVRSPEGNQEELGGRPEARFTPFFIDTGPFSADRVNLVGVEAATVQGPWWAQAEWIQSDESAESVGDPRFWGAYVEVGWFRTGESRFYRTQDGTFGRLAPNRLFHGGNPFTRKGDCGALEFVARVSTLDLNSALIRGGEMTDFSLGMNWYLSGFTRFMVNYIYSDVKNGGSANLLLMRFQFNP